MKQNQAFTFSYLIYLGIATLLHPIKTDSRFTGNGEIKSITKQEVSVARENIDVLHGELLFRF
jgi:hypothetical protein